MEDEYDKNNNKNDIIEENAQKNKLKKAEEELVEIKHKLEERNKLCLSQKLQIEDFTIEIKNLNGKLKSQENLIKFYQEKSEQEEEYIEKEISPEKKDKIKQLEIKNMKLNEKIKELEQNKIKLENDYEVLQQELEEEKSLNKKSLDELTKKYKDKIKASKEENDNYKDKISSMELEITQLKESNQRLENIKRINEKLLEKNNSKEDNKDNNEFIVEIQNLQNQMEEIQKKNAENLLNQKEEFEKKIKELKKINSELENNVTILKNDLARKDEDRNKQIKEKDKKIQDLINKSQKENNNYVKKIYDLSNQLQTANSELYEYKNKINEFTSNKTSDNPINNLQLQLDENKKMVIKLKEENDYYEKRIESLKADSTKAKKYDELEAKFKYNEGITETIKNNINELKEQKKKEKSYFDNELSAVNLELSTVKCELAKANFEKDIIVEKQQRYINKLKEKMGALGIKFKPKKIP